MFLLSVPSTYKDMIVAQFGEDCMLDDTTVSADTEEMIKAIADFVHSLTL